MARRRRRAQLLEQVTMDLGPPRSPWTFSRLVLRSRHLPRIRERLEFVRGFFPELSGVTVRVGLVRKPGVLGWGSLDPEQPGVWVRPRRLDHFTIAHELTHLLQARGLVPRGERACDLWALARSPLVVDHPPGYLALPRELRRLRRLEAAHSQLLHQAARRAIASRQEGNRRYLLSFERDIAARLKAAQAPVMLRPMDPTSLERSSPPREQPAARLRVVAAVVRREGRLLMTQRPPGGPLGLQWEFPGGKIEPGETPEQALAREVREELGVGATAGETLATETHAYPGGPTVEIVFIACELDSFELHRGPGVHDLRWQRAQEIDLSQVLAGDRPFLTRLGAGAA